MGGEKTVGTSSRKPQSGRSLMSDRVARITELMKQKVAIDAELKSLKDQIDKEMAALKKPRLPRKKKLEAVKAA
jgi:hypothetical protein